MAYLGNSPGKGNTVLQLEARKSFSFEVRLKEPRGAAADITGCSVTIVMKAQPQQASDLTDSTNLITNSVAEIDGPEGVARFNLQATDLDAPAGEYPYVVVLRTPDNYSVVIVKGVVNLLENTEYASVGFDYDETQPPLALDVYLRDLVAVEVSVGSILPPGYGYLSDHDKERLDTGLVPPGGTIGQVLVKASSVDLDTKWEDVEATGGGSLPATGVPAGQVPTANGANSWNWQAPASPDAVTETGTVDLNSKGTSGAYLFPTPSWATTANNFPENNVAGELRVVRTKTGSPVVIYQEYTALNPQRRWLRAWTSSTWTAWVEVALVGHTHNASAINAGVLAAARVPKVGNLNGITRGTAVPTGGTDWDLYFRYT